MLHIFAATLADSGSPIVRRLHTVTASNNYVHICLDHMVLETVKKLAKVEIMNQDVCQSCMWILALA